MSSEQLFDRYFNKYAYRYGLYGGGDSSDDDSSGGDNLKSNKENAKAAAKAAAKKAAELKKKASEAAKVAKEKAKVAKENTKKMANNISESVNKKGKQLSKNVMGTGKCVRYVTGNMNHADSNTYIAKTWTGKSTGPKVKGTKNRRSDGRSYQTVNSNFDNCGKLQKCYLTLNPGTYGPGKAYVPINTLTSQQINNFYGEGKLSDNSKILSKNSVDVETLEERYPEWDEQKGDSWWRISGDCRQRLPDNVNIYSEPPETDVTIGGSSAHTRNLNLLSKMYY
jgi:hypothetical protein